MCLPRRVASRAVIPGRVLRRWASSTSRYNHFIQKADVETLEPGQWRLAVKDNINTAPPLRTTAASSFLRNHEAAFEATIVRQLRALGGVVVGKTNMDEFGMGSHSTHSHFGPVLNPNFDKGVGASGEGGGEQQQQQERSAGGSSGGSAVAVRLGDALVALGTDTGGSIRLPAAYTGVFGYKPSYGLLSRNGVVKYADSLDTVGLLAPSADVLFDLVFRSRLAWEHDARDATSLPAASRLRCLGDPKEALRRACEEFESAAAPKKKKKEKLTIGIPREYFIEQLDPLIRDAWEEAELAVAGWGARVVPVDLPSTQLALSAYYVLAPAEASSNLARYDGQRYGTTMRNRTDPYEKEQEERERGMGYAELRGRHFGPEVRNRILMGTLGLSSGRMDNYFLQAARVRRLVRRDFDRAFRRPNPLCQGQAAFDLSDLPAGTTLEDKKGPAQVDFLLCPTAPTFPPLLEEVRRQDPVDSYMNDVFTVPASLAGLPAISVPVKVKGATAETGPVTGMQLIGQAWDDARLLLMAKRLSGLLEAKQ